MKSSKDLAQMSEQELIDIIEICFGYDKMKEISRDLFSLDPIKLTPKVLGSLFKLGELKYILKRIPKKMISKELFMIAVKSRVWNFEYVPSKFKTMEMSLFSVENDGMLLKLVPKSFQNAELSHAAIKSTPESLQYVVDQTPEICLFALEKKPSMYKLVTICPNPNYETTLKNLNRLKTISKNKEVLKKKIKGLE